MIHAGSTDVNDLKFEYMPKVSVILPIYGVEKYIERCAVSMFEQTLDDMEYIFVNDCTQDKSLEVLKGVISNYPCLEKRVVIVDHLTNKGLPKARETGFSCATGEYIAFCDTDDWVEKDAYRLMYEKAKFEDADLVICDYYKGDEKEHQLYAVKESYGLLQGPVWNKLIKADICRNISFPIANKAEDGAIMTQISYFSKKRVFLHKALYYYFSNPQSICRILDENSCILKMKQECENVEFRINFLKNKNVYEKYLKDVFLWKIQARDNLLPVISTMGIKNLWMSTYPEINQQIFKYGNYRIIIKFLLIKFNLFRVLRFFMSTK